MKYNLTRNFNDRIIELNQDEYDDVFKLSSDDKTKGMWLQGKYITFSDIKSIEESDEPDYNPNQLPEPEPLVVTPEIYDRRMRKVLDGIKAEVGENKFYKEMEKKLQNHQKTNTGLDANMGLT